VSRADDLLVAALKLLPEKPGGGPSAVHETEAPYGEDEEGEGERGRKRKRRYSELMSHVVAAALAEELRNRGLKEARPGGDGEIGKSGAERRMSGGIGAKKVDVTWATPEAGLILAISVKCLTSRDTKTGNYQKNLINRRGDMVGEAITLHRRFPYAALGGFFILDEGAEADATGKRLSTFHNAHRAFRLFTGRNDPAGRDEQYERLYIALVKASKWEVRFRIFLAGDPTKQVTLDRAIDDLLSIVADRDPDTYAILGPSGDVELEPGASPLSLARMNTSGTIVKGRKPKAAKDSVRKIEEAQLVLEESADDEDEDEDQTSE
jgi:hypothetical protein